MGKHYSIIYHPPPDVWCSLHYLIVKIISCVARVSHRHTKHPEPFAGVWYVWIIWYYASYMNKLDKEFGVDEGEEE